MPSDSVSIPISELNEALEKGCPAVLPLPEHLKRRGATGPEIVVELGKARAGHSQCRASFRGVTKLINDASAGLAASSGR
jgi:hypothetical protein